MATTNIVQPVATRSTPRAAAVSQLVRRPASARSTAASARSVTRCTHARWIDASSQATATALVSSQARPVAPMWRGSGGASPDGRRRRRAGRGGRPGVAASDAVHRSLGGCARTVRHEAHDAHVRTVGRRDDVTLSSPALESERVGNRAQRDLSASEGLFASLAQHRRRHRRPVAGRTCAQPGGRAGHTWSRCGDG